jgi:putative membrane protein
MLKQSLIAAGLLALALSPAAAQAQNKPAIDKDSQKFIASAIQGDIAEVDAGRLAQEKGKSQAVKDFGAMLVKEHGEHKTKAEAVAAQLDVKPPTGSSVAHKASYVKLKVLQGETFDRSFARTMVSDHQADIKMYQAQSGKSDAAGALAKETLPVLQHHLEVAQSLVRETTTTGQTPKR